LIGKFANQYKKKKINKLIDYLCLRSQEATAYKNHKKKTNKIQRIKKINKEHAQRTKKREKVSFQNFFPYLKNHQPIKIKMTMIAKKKM
jgi:hypothetical protein